MVKNEGPLVAQMWFANDGPFMGQHHKTPNLHIASILLRHELCSKNAPIIVNDSIYTVFAGQWHAHSHSPNFDSVLFMLDDGSSKVNLQGSNCTNRKISEHP